MKTLITAILISMVLLSCKSGENLSKQEQISQLTEKVEAGRYTFTATTAIPMGSKSINLSSSYSLKVSKDSIDAYLPYFGREYSPPMSSDEAGIKFLSTDFDYSISEKKKGSWNVAIGIKDNRKKYKLTLKIGDTGYATLNVRENERQSITFYGKIE